MEIISLPIVLDEDKVDSRYRFVIVVARRAKQMMENSPPQIRSRYKKATTIALEEFMEGKIEFSSGEEARAAEMEARRLREEEAKSQSLQARERDIVGEIKKELSVFVDDSQAPRQAEPGS